MWASDTCRNEGRRRVAPRRYETLCSVWLDSACSANGIIKLQLGGAFGALKWRTACQLVATRQRVLHWWERSFFERELPKAGLQKLSTHVRKDKDARKLSASSGKRMSVCQKEWLPTCVCFFSIRRGEGQTLLESETLKRSAFFVLRQSRCFQAHSQKWDNSKQRATALQDRSDRGWQGKWPGGCEREWRSNSHCRWSKLSKRKRKGSALGLAVCEAAMQTVGDSGA